MEFLTIIDIMKKIIHSLSVFDGLKEYRLTDNVCVTTDKVEFKQFINDNPHSKVCLIKHTGYSYDLIDCNFDIEVESNDCDLILAIDKLNTGKYWISEVFGNCAMSTYYNEAIICGKFKGMKLFDGEIYTRIPSIDKYSDNLSDYFINGFIHLYVVSIFKNEYYILAYNIADRPSEKILYDFYTNKVLEIYVTENLLDLILQCNKSRNPIIFNAYNKVDNNPYAYTDITFV